MKRIFLPWPYEGLWPNDRPHWATEGGLLMAAWSDSEVAILLQAYQAAGDGPLGLDALSEKLGRYKANVSRKARKLGLTNSTRRLVDQRKDRRKFGGDADALRRFQSEKQKRLLAENGHPRGALGIKHLSLIHV